jgi:DNA-binding transcriptional ArsR family regulator
VKPAVNGARFLRLLADDTRLRILTLLTRTSDLCVCELVAVLRLPQYRISRHLGELRRSDLLTSRRQGPFVFYRLSDRARRDPVQGPILRLVARIAGQQVAARDVGRMRRLMTLEAEQRMQACDAASLARTLRRRPLLRALPREGAAC